MIEAPDRPARVLATRRPATPTRLTNAFSLEVESHFQNHLTIEGRRCQQFSFNFLDFQTEQAGF